MGLFRNSPALAGDADRANKLLAWDATGTSIVYVSPEGGGGTAVYQQVTISITGEIAAGTTISATTSGPQYTVTGDALSLGGSAAEFAADIDLEINLNGLELGKGTGVERVSPTDFRIPDKDLHVGEVITIQQRTG